MQVAVFLHASVRPAAKRLWQLAQVQSHPQQSNESVRVNAAHAAAAALLEGWPEALVALLCEHHPWLQRGERVHALLAACYLPAGSVRRALARLAQGLIEVNATDRRVSAALVSRHNELAEVLREVSPPLDVHIVGDCPEAVLTHWELQRCLKAFEPAGTQLRISLSLGTSEFSLAAARDVVKHSAERVTRLGFRQGIRADQTCVLEACTALQSLRCFTKQGYDDRWASLAHVSEALV